jgi:diguanylate cyclase (GGDEF)-like protein
MGQKRLVAIMSISVNTDKSLTPTALRENQLRLRQSLDSLKGRLVSPETQLQGQQRVLELVARNASLKESLTEIARLAEEAFPDMSASILYFDPQAKVLRAGGYGRLPNSFAQSLEGMVPGPNMGSCGTCAYRLEPIISVDVLEDPIWANFVDLCNDHGIRSAWSTPMIDERDGTLLGVFGMYYPTVWSSERAVDISFAQDFHQLATIAAERYRDEERSRFLATHDAQTSLGNRNLLITQGEEIVSRAISTGSALTLAFIDLDRFKPIRQQFGHQQSDELFFQIAQRMSQSLDCAELLIRYDGDEFVAFLPLPIDEAKVLIAQMAGDMAAGFEMAEMNLQITFSCGLATYDHETSDMEMIIIQADEAARVAKQLGGGRIVIADQTLAARANSRRNIRKLLDLALEGDSIQPFYQPIMNLDTGRVKGFEALMRVTDENLKFVPVQELIGVAEETGQIHRIGFKIFESACKAVADPADPLKGLSVNVNISVAQLLKLGTTERILETVEFFGADPSRLCLELTESQWLDGEGPGRRALLELHSGGLKLALDDFGTGYASLNYLRSLPFDFIKVDQSFVNRIGQDRQADALCETVLALGKACGQDVVAEGVETPEQLKALKDMGYEFGQGFFWAKAMPLDVASQWLVNQSV